MERGDISNQIPPRWLFVFEGLIGEIPPGKVREAKMWRALGQWKRYADCYEISDHVRAQLHDITWRRNTRCEVVTFEPEQVADRIAERLDNMNVSVAAVKHYPSPRHLVHSLPYMPEVQYVVHGFKEFELSFGPRGHFGLQGV